MLRREEQRLKIVKVDQIFIWVTECSHKISEHVFFGANWTPSFRVDPFLQLNAICGNFSFYDNMRNLCIISSRTHGPRYGEEDFFGQTTFEWFTD
jgi:hypothetical protein